MKFEDEVSIKSNPEEIYKLLVKPTNFSKLVPELKVKVIEQDDEHHYKITDCQLSTEKEEFNWRQRENYDPELLTIHYSLVDGDWHSFDASWKIMAAGEETELFFQAEVIAKDQGLKSYLYWPFFRKRMRQTCREIIQAVKDRLELSYGQSL